MNRMRKFFHSSLFAVLCFLLLFGNVYAGPIPDLPDQKEGILELKLKSLNEEELPAADVSFLCFPVGKVADTSGEEVQYQLTDSEFAGLLGLEGVCGQTLLWETIKQKDAETFEAYAGSHSGIRTEKTDSSGLTSVKLSTGLYLVLFDQVPDGYRKGMPFLISMPMLIEREGTAVWTYQMQVSPKMEEETEPEEPEGYGAAALTKTFQGKPAEDKSIYQSVTFRLEDSSGNQVRAIKEGDGRYRAVAEELGETELRVGSDGLLIVRHLPNGSYTFTELTTQEKYQLLADPVQVTIADATSAFTVDNKKKSLVPFTGGSGTAFITGVGTVLLVVGVFVLLTTGKKKRRKKGRRRPGDRNEKKT